VHVIAVVFAALLVLVTTSSAVSAEPVPLLEWDVVSRRTHDTGAFTQGLQLASLGRLYESTGRYGESTLRETDADSGEVLRSLALRDEWFGEGLALLDEDLIQLTWRAGIAVRRDVKTFELVDTYDYEGEGWGLCFDGERLVMSDGSDRLTFRDAGTFEATGSLAVTFEGQPLGRLNELECVEGSVWANVWGSDAIVRIDPADGRVDGLLDLRGILEPHPAASDAGAVLNGIAWNATTGTFLVTGKLWPELIEIRVSDPAP